jgi:hypothetical protein
MRGPRTCFYCGEPFEEFCVPCARAAVAEAIRKRRNGELTFHTCPVCVYREPSARAGEDRRPTLTRPRMIPIDGEAADMVKLVVILVGSGVNVPPSVPTRLALSSIPCQPSG